MVTSEEMFALHVVVLGSGGGPDEANTTALLVRPTASGWSKGSVLAVDGGVGISKIKEILAIHKKIVLSRDGKVSTRGATLIDGPFEGLEISHDTAGANAKAFYVDMIDSILFTHPHMDHIKAAIVNTAVSGLTRQKRYVALPSTIEALKNHVFNGIIWPNLTDENNGAGIISYVRLVEGGSPTAGEGESKGYVEIVPGLGVKAVGISHGTCMERHERRGSTPMLSPSLLSTSRHVSPFPGNMVRSSSNASATLEPGGPRIVTECVYNSTAFFIRDTASGREILVFGDVEPDSVSLAPRNEKVWAAAAPKIASGHLTSIFIECSYDDTRENDQLFGHMTPSHLMVELKTLSNMVARCGGGGINSNVMSPKRKRNSNGGSPRATDSPQSKARRQGSPIRWRGAAPLGKEHHHSGRRHAYSGPSRSGPIENSSREKFAEKSFRPLNGLKVVILHVKDELDDERDASDIISKQLNNLEKEADLGCEFIVSISGQSLYF